MREIIYDVAVSIDGFIAAPGGDVSAFPQTGPHATAYLKRLEGYGTTVMGRKTYEFGYRYGLPPGARAYPHMDHHIFSTSLELPTDSDVNVVGSDWRATVESLRAQPGEPIYLCGGGQFAGWMLAEGFIDRLWLKIAPVTLGTGVPLFAGVDRPAHWRKMALHAYKNGVVLVEYARP